MEIKLIFSVSKKYGTYFKTKMRIINLQNKSNWVVSNYIKKQISILFTQKEHWKLKFKIASVQKLIHDKK